MTEDQSASGSPVERPLGPGTKAHKLTDQQIADLGFAVLRAHNDDRLWRALTYSSGPYEVTTPTLALCHLARVFFAAGVIAALGGCSGMTQPEDVAVAEELCSKRGGYANVTRYERSANLLINCKDGTYIDMRPPSKAERSS